MFLRSLVLGLMAASTLSFACAAQAQTPARPVILIGIDGFRADYLDRGVTPNLSRLAAEGVTAEGGMRPSWPSVTFPNFITLATGLHPDHHGLVYNRMRDPHLPGRTFTLGNPAEATDRVWYEDAEPIWVTARKAGLRTAAMFWPGAEAPIRGVRPTYWLPFEQSITSAARVNILLGWFSLPPEERPQMATLYFDTLDLAGHASGPGSPEADAAMADIDAQIGRLVVGLAERGLQADLVIVADHGMTPVSADRILYLDDRIEASAFNVTAWGAFATLDPAPGREAEVEAALLGAAPHMECWRKGEVPARFVYGTHRRIPAIVCLAELGWTIGTRERTNPARIVGGTHGYDNTEHDMRALFIANGPAFRRGASVPEMDSVDVQPLVARLLGLTIPAGDGRPEDTLPAMAD